MYSINYICMLQAHYTTDNAIMTQLYTYMVNIIVPICKMSCMHINICGSDVSNTLSAYFTSPAIFSLSNNSTHPIVCICSHGVVYRHCSNVYTHCIAFPHTAYHTINTTYLLWPYCIMLAYFHCNCVYTPICASQ